MSGYITVPIDALSVTTDVDQDIIELTANTTLPYRIYSLELESDCTTDERVRLRLVRGRTSTGSGGGAITGLQVDGSNTTTVGVTATSLVTTPGSAGTVLRGWRWSQLNKLQYQPPPEARYLIPAATRCSLHLNSAVASTRLWSGELILELVG